MSAQRVPRHQVKQFDNMYKLEEQLFEFVDGKVEGMKAFNARRKARRAVKKGKGRNISNSSSSSDLTSLYPLPEPPTAGSSILMKSPEHIEIADPMESVLHSEAIADRNIDRQHNFPPRSSSHSAPELMERMRVDSLLVEDHEAEKQEDERPVMRGASAARIQLRALTEHLYGSPEAIKEKMERSFLRSNIGRARQLIPSSDPYSAAVADFNLAKEASVTMPYDDLMPKPLVIRKRANSKFTEHC